MDLNFKQSDRGYNTGLKSSKELTDRLKKDLCKDKIASYRIKPKAFKE